MGFKDWQTPPQFFKDLDAEFHFTLDAAASHENALLPRYCTVTGCWEKFFPERPELEASHRIACEDGLAYSWEGQRVFCNPPYDSSLYQWVAKAAKREADVAVLLLPPSVDTAWFHRLILEANQFNGKLERCYDGSLWRGFGNYELTLLFREGRLKFWKDGKPGPAPRAGNMLAIFRK